MDTNFYDVVVCGGETTGLVAAALLARRGFRVLLLGHEPAHAGFDIGGVPLSRAPAFLPPIDEPPAMRVFKELDCTVLVRRRAGPVRTALRVVMQGGHLDLPADSVGFERELGRAYGAAGPRVGAVADRLGGVGRLLDPLLASAITLPPNGFWERREVGRLESFLPRPRVDAYAPLDADHPFRVAGAAPGALSTALSPQEVGPVAEARAFEIARRGTPIFEGGLAGFHDFLLARFEAFGGDRRERLTPVEIVVRRGRAVGVRVLPRDETIGCHHLVWAGPAATLRAALGANAPSGTRRGPGPLRVDGYRHALALLCETGALPEGTPQRILLIGDAARPFAEDNAIAISVGVPNPRTPERLPIWAECAVPPQAIEASAAYLRGLRARLVHTIRRALPELERGILLVASPFDGLPAEGPAAATGKLSPPAIPPPLFSPPSPRALDVLGLPHATGIKHLYLGGRENLPGLDLEGELISGWGVAHLVSGGHVRRSVPERRMLLGG